MTTYNEYVLYNTSYKQYGSMITIQSKYLKSINTMLSIIIVGLYPVPIALMINRLIKDIKWRY